MELFRRRKSNLFYAQVQAVVFTYDMPKPQRQHLKGNKQISLIIGQIPANLPLPIVLLTAINSYSITFKIVASDFPMCLVKLSILANANVAIAVYPFDFRQYVGKYVTAQLDEEYQLCVIIRKTSV